MASLGHIAVGLATTRLWGPPSGGPKHFFIKAALFWSAISFLPDADVIGFPLGVRYEDEWGHRGATHSLAFAVLLGAAIGVIAQRFRFPAIRTGITAILVLISHALLDTLTDGGLGIALLWPFDLTRYFAPWRPIPVSPIGLAFFSPYGMVVAITEVVVFAPVWWFALRRRSLLAKPEPRTAARAGLLLLWCVALWLVASTDPLRERVMAAVLRDDTEYARDYTHQAFGAVERGMLEIEVRERLGRPFNEFVFYPEGEGRCMQVRIADDLVTDAQPANWCKERGIVPSRSRLHLYETLGQPASSCWVYSRPATGGFFRARGVCFVGGRVDETMRRWVRE